MNEVVGKWVGFNGQTAALSFAYNPQGLISQRIGPCFSPGSACSTSSKYIHDNLGRITGIEHEDGDGPKWQYSGLTTTHYDPLGNQRSTLQDQLGRVIRSAAVITGNRQIATTFAYEPFGLVSTITDTYGNVTRTVHDVRGRPQLVNDLDSGDHFYQWDCYDELLNAQDGNGFYTSYVPDGIGRIQSVTNKDGTASFTWDTSPNGIGKLASATSTDGVTTSYTYNPSGQTATTTWEIDGNTYRFALGYDNVGRLKNISYPSAAGQPAFAIQRNYNQFGFLYQVLDANTGSVFWQADAENERGEITAEHFQNGVSTQQTFNSRGRVTSIATTKQNQTLQNLSYSYYPNGSLHSRNNEFVLMDDRYALGETFQYDSLDRLSSIHSIGFFIPRSRSPLQSGRRPRQIFDETFVYDDVGNLKQQTINEGTGTKHVQLLD